MIRWVSVSFGLAIAALAFYLLLRGGAAPMDDIDTESRARLEQVLPEAEGNALP